MIQSMVVGFYLLGVDATLGNECTIQEHLHSFRKVKYLQGFLRLFGWIYKTVIKPEYLSLVYKL